MSMLSMTKKDLKYAVVQLKAALRKKLDDGAECPVCGQHAQIYRRKIHAGMARSLIQMHQAAAREWVKISEVVTQRADEAKLAHWGLIEEERILRPDGGRAGYWRVTWKGELFVQGRIKVPKYAEIYNGKLVGMDSTEMVTIKDALGTKFDYAELMAGT